MLRLSSEYVDFNSFNRYEGPNASNSGSIPVGADKISLQYWMYAEFILDQLIRPSTIKEGQTTFTGRFLPASILQLRQACRAMCF